MLPILNATKRKKEDAVARQNPLGASLDVHITVQPDVRVSVHDAGAVLLDINKGLMFSSNRIGASIWTGLVNQQTPRSIAAALSRQYDAPLSDVERDTVAFIAELRDREFICEAELRQKVGRA